MRAVRRRAAAAPVIVFLLLCGPTFAQQTVFNVPSGDVLERGKVYGELDLTYSPADFSGTFTPRVVVGVGHRVEVGLNANGLAATGLVHFTPTPTAKWKAYEGGSNGWALLIGDDVFLPALKRQYRAGNYVYAQFTKTWNTRARATFGAFDSTRGVVASGNRAGGQFAIEQPIASRVTLAADWFTGHHAMGYVSPGVIVKLARQLTAYVCYQVGNASVKKGNHQLLVEIGWNFN